MQAQQIQERYTTCKKRKQIGESCARPLQFVFAIPPVRIEPTNNLKTTARQLGAARARDANLLAFRKSLISANLRHTINVLNNRPPRVRAAILHTTRKNSHDVRWMLYRFKVCPVFQDCALPCSRNGASLAASGRRRSSRLRTRTCADPMSINVSLYRMPPRTTLMS